MSKVNLTEYDGDVFALRDGHIAVSPFEDYPGTIKFPNVFTGKLYKAYVGALRDGEAEQTLTALWDAFQAVKPVIKVAGMSADYDKNDMRLNRWAIAMVLRWVNPFLTETPWQRPSGTGTPNGVADPG
jgi:hypothetical protein